MTSKYCCDDMQREAERTCDQHPDRFECPDCLVQVSDYGRVGLIIHDGGASILSIRFCPWCGKKLPETTSE